MVAVTDKSEFKGTSVERLSVGQFVKVETFYKTFLFRIENIRNDGCAEAINVETKKPFLFKVRYHDGRIEFYNSLRFLDAKYGTLFEGVEV